MCACVCVCVCARARVNILTCVDMKKISTSALCMLVRACIVNHGLMQAMLSNQP